MNIRTVTAESLHSDRQTDRQTDIWTDRHDEACSSFPQTLSSRKYSCTPKIDAASSLSIYTIDNIHGVTGQKAVKLTFTLVRNSDVDRAAVALQLRNSSVADFCLIQNNVTVLFPGS